MDIGKISSNSIDSMANDATRAASQAADDNFAKKLEAAMQNKDDKELKKACQEFEGIMLNMLYKQMKATIHKSDLVEKDPGSEIFESLQDDNLMELASETGSFGLAESLYKQLSKHSGTGAKNVSKEAVQASEPVLEKNGE